MNSVELIKINSSVETFHSKNIWNGVIDELKEYSREVSIDNRLAYKYRFDFSGLLSYLNIPTKYHYPNTIVNGYSNSTEFTGDREVIKIVDSEFLYRMYEKINEDM